MSWEDQGRQEHGWFGHGTAPPKDKGQGTISSTDVAAVRAYLWARRYGPALFGLPRSGAALDGFAEGVMRLERASPGSMARALGTGLLVHVSAAQGAFGERAKATRDGLLTLAQDREDEAGPTRMPGGGFGELTPGEELRTAEFGQLIARLRQAEPDNLNLRYLRAPDAAPSEEEIIRLRAEVAAAEERARLGQPPERLGVPEPERRGVGEPSQMAPGGEALHFHDWDKAVPTTRDGVLGGVPTGTPADETRGKPETRRGLKRENEAAKALAAAGYQVEQNPSRRPTDTNDPKTKPDLRVGENLFEVYSPKTSNPDTVRDVASEKATRQADRLVINLADSTVTPDQVRDVLARKPVSGLREVLIIDQQGQISRLLPQPTAIR